MVSLSMPNARSCKNFWRSCVDHHAFYSRRNLHAISKPRYISTQEIPPMLSDFIMLLDSTNDRVSGCGSVEGLSLYIGN